MLTRTIANRRFLLRPSEVVNAWNLFKEIGEACFPEGTLMMHHRHFQEREEENGFFDWCVRMQAPA